MPVTNDQEGVESRHLADLVKRALSTEDRKQLGSVSWYTTTVKLDMEVRGEIERLPGSRPKRIRRLR